jgi:hypothetical protein
MARFDRLRPNFVCRVVYHLLTDGHAVEIQFLNRFFQRRHNPEIQRLMVVRSDALTWREEARLKSGRDPRVSCLLELQLRYHNITVRLFFLYFKPASGNVRLVLGKSGWDASTSSIRR